MSPPIALLSSPGMGHMIPVLELGHRLASTFGARVTVFLVITDAQTVKSQLEQEYSEYKHVLDVVVLPQVDLSSLMDRSMATTTQLFLIMRHSLQSLRSAISSMESRPTALIVDIFGAEAFAVADEFRMLKYVFFTTNAWYLSLFSYLPYLSREDDDDHVTLHKPLKIPGCESIRFEDTIGAFSNRHDPSILECCKKAKLEWAGAQGILVNTWESLEPKTLGSLRDSKTMGQFLDTISIYPIGPLTRRARLLKQEVPRNKVLVWLDRQPAESVLYISFGSGGTLSANQLAELACGLERSRQRFIWVVRPPREDSVSGAFFKLSNRTDETPEYLPDGFMTRTRDTGLVVPTWAPQADVLSHPSVGGFLSHCGWNSTLESILNGVPMIAWPLYAEQKMNAVLLSEQLGVAVKPSKQPSSGIIERDEIEAMVRRVMEKDGIEGKQLRSRAQELKCSAVDATTVDGPSHSMLMQVVRECECGRERLEETRSKA